MSGSGRRLILFARYPVPGRVKTRLIPALGPAGAAALHRRLVLRTLRTARAACEAAGADLEVRFADGDEAAVRHWLGLGERCSPQRGAELGARMADAFAASFAEGATASVLIGSDCPTLTPAHVVAAFDALSHQSAVFGPARDGGYYLVGLDGPRPELFRGPVWGTGTVLAESLAILARLGIVPARLEPLEDLDRPEDLAVWQRCVAREDAHLERVSIVVPALNEAAQLAATLQSAQAGRPYELVVVDGGSRDATAALARDAGADVVSTPPGRARQMNAGAARATGGVLMFLHADTRLPADWPRALGEALARPGAAGGAFRFRIAEPFPGRRFVEWTTHLRSRWGQRPYGDQALFLPRAVFEELGGFARLPIMEDVEFVARLRRRGRIVTAGAAVETSGRRWRRLGVWRTTAINKLVVMGYRLGVDPQRLARLYRGPGSG